MTIPDFQQFMLPILRIVKDGEEHKMREVIEKAAEMFNLSHEERTQLLPSGKQYRYENRIGWARTYLKKAGLLSTPSRGLIKITERGKEVLKKNPPKIDTNFLEQFPEYLEFKNYTRETEPEQTSDLTPEEILDGSYQDLRNELAHDLLERVKSCSPEFFERLVIDLLVGMGYGGSRSDAGQRVGKSGDGGIDGIIKEDKLGLDVINVQAKRWQNTVGRPEIQAFVGSLAGNRAKKGVFITTSKFTDNAKDYVSFIQQNVVLIDGEQLTQLMIDHDIGVSEESRYIVKKIDLDYFEDN
jgi:restriction system protein